MFFFSSAKGSWTLHVGSRHAGEELASGGVGSRGEAVIESMPSPSDAENRQAAMDRLLSNKRRETSVETVASAPPATVNEAKATEAPRVVAMPSTPPAVVPVSRTDENVEEKKTEEKKDEPSPSGFLAQLGRDDS
jgi:hypothetical protein